MSLQRHERLSSLFLEASELRGDDRQAFIAEQCAGDPSLEKELRDMLGAEQERSELLLTGAMAGGLDLAPTAPPESIGPYRIGETLGEGGMGIVYKGRQEEPIQRDVAIKLIKLGLETENILRRFDAERQTLARMNHPGIARVIDAGQTETGRSFFAMEFVDGVPITQFCDDQRLSLEERIELFVQVCDAVQHAHRNAIIHRDLKPSNILCAIQDGRPVAKVIDFGIAKALDNEGPNLTRATQADQLFGTPEYMSPEQTWVDKGQIDTRTDVYSLGVVLYELLTGVLPIASESLRKLDLAQLHDQIRRTEPTLPSRMGPSNELKKLRGDLDAVIIKSLEKERDRRYDSPTELSRDLRRYIDGEPVHARAPRLSYKLFKWIRRHKAATATAGTILIGGITVLALTSVQQSRLERERQRSEREAASAEQIANLVETMLGAQSTTEIRRFNTTTTRDLFERGQQQLSTVVTQPHLKARLTHAFGSMKLSIGEPLTAIPLLESAIELYDSLPGDPPLAMLAAKKDLAVGFGRVGKAETALSTFEQLIDELVQAVGESAPLYRDTSAAYGIALKDAQRWKDAEGAFRIAIGPPSDDAQRQNPEDAKNLVYTSLLASVLIEQNRFAEAEAILLSILEPMRSALSEDHTEFRAALYNLAVITAMSDQPAKARRMLSEIPGGPPRDPWSDPFFDSLQQLSDPASPIRAAQSVGDRSHELRQLMRLWVNEDFAASRDRARRLFESNRLNLGDSNFETGQAFSIYAWSLILTGECTRSDELWPTARTSQVFTSDSTGFDVLESVWIDAHCALQEGDRTEAIRLTAEAIQLLGAGGRSADDQQLASLIQLRAEYHALLGEAKEAVGYARQLLDEPWYSFRLNPAFQFIRDDPGFIEFLKEEAEVLRPDLAQPAIR